MLYVLTSTLSVNKISTIAIIESFAYSQESNWLN